jgi:hypothetical protein
MCGRSPADIVAVAFAGCGGEERHHRLPILPLNVRDAADQPPVGPVSLPPHVDQRRIDLPCRGLKAPRQVALHGRVEVAVVTQGAFVLHQPFIVERVAQTVVRVTQQLRPLEALGVPATTHRGPNSEAAEE